MWKIEATYFFEETSLDFCYKVWNKLKCYLYFSFLRALLFWQPCAQNVKLRFRMRFFIRLVPLSGGARLWLSASGGGRETKAQHYLLQARDDAALMPHLIRQIGSGRYNIFSSFFQVRSSWVSSSAVLPKTRKNISDRHGQNQVYFMLQNGKMRSIRINTIRRFFKFLSGYQDIIFSQSSDTNVVALN